MSAQLKGAKELVRKLETLGDRVARKALRSAASAGATPLVRAAKAKVKKRTGLLKKSLGKKVVVNKKTQTATAIVGARKSVVGPNSEKPARYLHLVEKGHVNERGEHVAAQPFLAPAAAETEQQSVDAMASKLAEVVEAEWRKSS